MGGVQGVSQSTAACKQMFQEKSEVIEGSGRCLIRGNLILMSNFLFMLILQLVLNSVECLPCADVFSKGG